MPLTHRVTCDACGEDLTRTSNGEDFRLALRNERVPSAEGVVTLVGCAPHLKAEAFFCGTRCLKAWAVKYL